MMRKFLLWACSRPSWTDMQRAARERYEQQLIAE